MAQDMVWVTGFIRILTRFPTRKYQHEGGLEFRIWVVLGFRDCPWWTSVLFKGNEERFFSVKEGIMVTTLYNGGAIQGLITGPA